MIIPGTRNVPFPLSLSAANSVESNSVEEVATSTFQLNGHLEASLSLFCAPTPAVRAPLNTINSKCLILNRRIDALFLRGVQALFLQRKAVRDVRRVRSGCWFQTVGVFGKRNLSLELNWAARAVDRNRQSSRRRRRKIETPSGTSAYRLPRSGVRKR